MHDRCSIAVVGSGPAGAAHAAALAEAGESVLLVGAGGWQRPGTVELLSGRLRPLLDRLGVLETVEQRAPACGSTVFRWGAPRFAERSAAADPWGPGWAVDRAWLDPLLERAAVARGARLLRARVRGLQRERGRWALRCARGDGTVVSVAADAVTIAAGRSAAVAVGGGLLERRRVRDLVAVTAWAPELARLGPRLLVDAAADGWWYAMGDGSGATVGYVTDAPLLAGGVDRLRAAWETARPGWLPAVGARLHGRPAFVQASAWPDGDDDLIAIGDAALALDPLSGHGLAVALEGALVAAERRGDYRDWHRERLARALAEEPRVYAPAAARRPASRFWSLRAASADGLYAGGDDLRPSQDAEPGRRRGCAAPHRGGRVRGRGAAADAAGADG
jgi:2-polyprenyl-6-methoxyphenol hydroxylase-like FAD-dependent oxidoreductase